MKLKDDKTCYRHDSESVAIRKLCRSGYCTIFCCPYCRLEKFSAGPIDCPCKKNENSTLRWYKYPDMDIKPHVPVKRNALKRQHAYKKRSWREKT